MARQQIYLIPGFFGFTNIGPVVYFSHAKSTLQRLLNQREIDAEIHCVRHSPVASLIKRSQELGQEILKTSYDRRSQIHLIGHSSGGLDARLLLCPNTSWERSTQIDDLRSRVCNVVSIATPHHGTPLVSFLSGYIGARFLQALSLATVTLLRTGSIPWKTVIRLAQIWVRMRLPSIKQRKQFNLLFSEFESSMLEQIVPSERDSIRDFFAEVGKDQTLIAQLMPEAMELAHSLCQDSPHTRYASVIARAQPPSWKHQFRFDFAPYQQSAYIAYRWLHSCAGNWSGITTNRLHQSQFAKIVESYPFRINESDNDGIIPTLSQVYGKIIHAAQGDHLDIIGHFDGDQDHREHVDWLPSASNFGNTEYLRLWTDVADQIADCSRT